MDNMLSPRSTRWQNPKVVPFGRVNGKLARGGVAVGGGGVGVGTKMVGVGVMIGVGSGAGASMGGTGITVTPGVIVGVGAKGVGEAGITVGRGVFVGIPGSPCPTVICPFSGVVGIS
jgi:hypothetical protein